MFVDCCILIKVLLLIFCVVFDYKFTVMLGILFIVIVLGYLLLFYRNCDW